jgi:hypothetical protein
MLRKKLMFMAIDPRLHRIVAMQPCPLLFATISGGHLYAFGLPSGLSLDNNALAFSIKRS